MRFVGAVFSLVVLSTASADSLRVYVGTYTGGGANSSKGIYRSTLDLETGTLSTPVLAAEARNPSFVEIHPNGKFLYAVSEAGDERTRLCLCHRRGTGDLTLLNDASTGGAGPCHVNVDHAGKHVLVANYGSGSASVIPIQAGRQARGADVDSCSMKGPA